uniref:Uncharacterized protein n=1 Tax=Anguilla anguilla TaxID=7936 RepID=A0A0E9RS07_ANGAN
MHIIPPLPSHAHRCCISEYYRILVQIIMLHKSIAGAFSNISFNFFPASLLTKMRQ